MRTVCGSRRNRWLWIRDGFRTIDKPACVKRICGSQSKVGPAGIGPCPIRGLTASGRESSKGASSSESSSNQRPREDFHFSGQAYSGSGPCRTFSDRIYGEQRQLRFVSKHHYIALEPTVRDVVASHDGNHGRPARQSPNGSHGGFLLF